MTEKKQDRDRSKTFLCLTLLLEFLLSCSCPPGFEGDLCEINIDDCVDIQCSNGGTCLDLVNDFRCICAPTFSGPFCETGIHPSVVRDRLCRPPPCGKNIAGYTFQSSKSEHWKGSCYLTTSCGLVSGLCW